MKKILLIFLLILSTSVYAYDCYNMTSTGISDAGNFTYNGGDINITSDLNVTCIAVSWNLAGNISVYGNLTLSDVDLLVGLTNTTSYSDVTSTYGIGTGYNLNTTSTWIRVFSGGKLNITNFTNITANESWDNNNFWCGYEFVAFAGSVLEIRNSEFKHVGCNNRSDFSDGAWQSQWTRYHGIRIETNYSRLINNTIYVNGSWAINFWDSSHNWAENNTIIGRGISLLGGGVLIANAGPTTANISNGYNNTAFNNTITDVHHGLYGWNAVNNTYVNNTVYTTRGQIQVGSKTGHNYGVLLYNYSKNNTIENNTIFNLTEGESAAIWLETNVSFNKIKFNQLYDNSDGIYFVGGTGANHTINNNIIHGGSDAVGIGSSLNATISNNIVYSLYLGVSVVNNSVVLNNTIYATNNFAIYADGNYITIANNTIHNNTGVGIYFGAASPGTYFNQIIGNDIYNTTSYGIQVGTRSYWANNTIAGNNITQNNYGLYIVGSNSPYLYNITIENNTITDNTNDGAYVGYVNNSRIRFNTFNRNGGYGLNLQAYNNTVANNTLCYNKNGLYNATTQFRISNTTFCVTPLTYPGNNTIQISNPMSTLTFNISNPVFRTSCQLYLNNFISGTNTTIYNNNITNITNSTFLSDGSYTWSIYCNNSSTSIRDSGQSLTYNFIVLAGADIVLPNYYNNSTSYNGVISESGIYNPNNNIGFQINCTDETSMTNAFLEIDGTTNYTMNNITNDIFYYNLTNQPVSAINYKMYCNDSSSNTVSTASLQFILSQNTTISPQINILSPSNTTYATTPIWFNITTDLNGIYTNTSSCWVNFTTIKNYTLTNSTGNWNYQNSTLPDGHYNATIWCNNTDTNYTSNTNASSIMFTVDVFASQFSSNYTSKTNGTQYYPNNNFGFQIDFIDTVGISQVYLETNTSNGTIYYNYTPTQSGNTFYYNFTDREVQNMRYRWFANDTYNQWNYTDGVDFTISKNSSVYPQITNISPSNITYLNYWFWANVSTDLNGVYTNTSWCGVSMNSTANQTLTNSTGNWNLNISNIENGAHNITFYCNNSNANYTVNVNQTEVYNFTIYVDSIPPVRSDGNPSGTLYTTSASLSVTTNENAVCRYANSPTIPFASMLSTTQTTSGLTHSWSLSGLAVANYNYYIKCNDTLGNANSDDYLISFAVATQPGSDGGGGGDSTIEPEVPETPEEVVPGEEFTIPEGGTAIAIDDMLSIQVFGDTGIIYNITKVEASKFKIILCNQTEIASYEINISAEKTYFCIDTANYSYLSSISVYQFKNEDWNELTEIIQNGTQICARIASTPYMIAGFSVPADSEKALYSLNLLESRISTESSDELLSLLEQAKNAYYNCDYDSSYDLSQEALRKIPLQLPIMWLWILLMVIIISIGYYLYKNNNKNKFGGIFKKSKQKKIKF